MDPVSISAIVLSIVTIILVKVKKSKCGKASCETRSEAVPDTPDSGDPVPPPRHKHKHKHKDKVKLPRPTIYESEI
jgi:hypothetical protein